MQPTDEQQAALDLFSAGDSMVIEAGAGTGKTSTLKLIADSTPKRGHYLAFNKAVVVDVAGKMPDRCSASTAHSLAFRAVGRRYAHRLNAHRMQSRRIAQMLNIHPMYVSYGKGMSKKLADGWCAGHVMRALGNFCRTADHSPSYRHFPYVDGIDLPDGNGKRTFANNNRIALDLEPALRRAWDDIQRVEGQLPFKHDHYLKIWQLGHPTLDFDYLLFDEAQDADPVIAAVVAEQKHAQLVYVGDAQQAIYEWRGAVNAIETFESDKRTMLTQSFRFGPEIANEANLLLTELDAALRLRGTPTIESTVGALAFDERADAILCRTNATAVSTILKARRGGTVTHLVGGGGEVLAFTRAAKQLKDDGWTAYPDLACFESWGEVQAYVEDDPQGSELRMLVDLVDEYGIPLIMEALDDMPREETAQLIVSTAHKAKGREWNVVQLADDFGPMEPTTGELRLRYVACTRAQRHLDNSALKREKEVSTHGHDTRP